MGYYKMILTKSARGVQSQKAAEKQMVLTAYFVFKHELCEKHQPTIAPSPSKGIS